MKLLEFRYECFDRAFGEQVEVAMQIHVNDLFSLANGIRETLHQKRKEHNDAVP
jgi:hypothetical protein